MVEARSALEGRYSQASEADAAPGVTLCELVGWDLLQATAWRGRFDALATIVRRELGVAPPREPNRAVVHGALSLLSVAPRTCWCLAPLGEPRLVALAGALPAASGCVTQLGHGQVRLHLQGAALRRLLAQEIALDLAPRAFPAGTLARTTLHRVAVLLRCLDADAELPAFELMVPRSFAASTWDHLCELARADGYAVAPRRTPVVAA